MLLENGSRRTVRKVILAKLANENNLTSNLIIFNVGYNYIRIEMKQLQFFQFACRGYCLKKKRYSLAEKTELCHTGKSDTKVSCRKASI